MNIIFTIILGPLLGSDTLSLLLQISKNAVVKECVEGAIGISSEISVNIDPAQAGIAYFFSEDILMKVEYVGVQDEYDTLLKEYQESTRKIRSLNTLLIKILADLYLGIDGWSDSNGHTLPSISDCEHIELLAITVRNYQKSVYDRIRLFIVGIDSKVSNRMLQSSSSD
jgi:hypothetical protein